jgi:Tfp pilus assembly protein PilF
VGRFLAGVVCAGVALAQTADLAYEALRAKDYDRAIAAFQQAIAAEPARAALRKDLAYTLLKVGEAEAARDQFAEAMRLDPADQHVALEYAFLCYETKRQAEARRIFDRVRKTGDTTAAAAFENIDRPLREGIARWRAAVAVDPANFSAHEELARLAEQRDEVALAAEHYEAAWRLRPDRCDLLLDLGRAWQTLGRGEEAMAALIAASRGGNARVAEEAQDLLPKRYPYVYEFERAIALDGLNIGLRKELAYLHLEMGHRAQAEALFEWIVQRTPDDSVSAAQLRLLRPGAGQELKRPDVPRAPVPNDARLLGERSLEKGYLQDALKYLRIAHENDPVDFGVMLKLGWAYNILKEDEEAAKWFSLARKSPDVATASEANRAYRNLQPELERVRTSIWVNPMFSTRWHDAFTYAQAKAELQMPHWWVHPYMSVRFIGDARGKVELGAGLGPQYLSERSVIVGAGVITKAWHGAIGWFEAGESLRYRTSAVDSGRAVPDYRGGISYAKGFGHLLARGEHGMFLEGTVDGVFVSRFGNDLLLYSQDRFGYTLRAAESLGGLHAQFLWNWNFTVDSRGEYWANTVETGPGIRLRFENWPASLMFSVSALTGVYLVQQGNPRGPTFLDLRVGIWYAFAR